jgi:hypothetical protein
MSHYTVLVTLPAEIAPDQVTAALHVALAPFDENIEGERHRHFATEAVPRDHWYYRALTNDGVALAPDISWPDLIAAYAEHNPDFDKDELLQWDGTQFAAPFEWSTYNPLSKWDWYAVGGRWSGYFQAKPDARPQDIIAVDYRGVFGDQAPPPEPGQCDGGRKRALDLDGMREAAAAKAEADWNAYAAVVFGTEPALPWKVFVEKVDRSGNSGYTIDEARRDYREQSRIVAIQSAPDYKEAFLFNPHDEFDPFTRDEYVKRMRDNALTGYATLDTVFDGGWIAAGEMGWFGMSSDTPDDKADYGARMASYIDKLGDEDWLVMVDCHI